MPRHVSLLVLSMAAVLLSFPAAAAETDFVLKAACIGGAGNTVDEVSASADGLIQRRRQRNGRWQVLGRDAERVKRWVAAVDATRMTRVRVSTTVDRNPCKVGSTRPCHIVRRKGETEYYACQSKSVLSEMMDFDEWTNQPRSDGAETIVDEWRVAFLTANIDELVKLYAPEALFLGTDSKTVVRGREGIRVYFENLFRNQKPREATTSSELVALTTDVLVATGTIASARMVTGPSVPDRVTFVIIRREGQWLIEHFHSSAMPD